jgi:hypothetical protein
VAPKAIKKYSPREIKSLDIFKLEKSIEFFSGFERLHEAGW